MLQDRIDQSLRVGGAYAAVDVQTIGRTPQSDDVGAQFMKHFGGDLVGCTMGCVYNDPHTLEGQIMRESAFTKLDVTTCGIIESFCFTQVSRSRPHRFLGQSCLHLQLPGIAELSTLGAEKLDPIVIKGIVAGTDHHTQGRSLGASEVCNSWCGDGTQEHHIHTRGIEAGLQSTFEHVTGYASIFADQNRRMTVLSFEHSANGMGQAQHKIRSDGTLADGPTDAVSSKILSGHAIFPDTFYGRILNC
jgi:hypothetical protein